MVDQSTNIWNPLNASLFASLALSAFATAVPVALVTPMSNDLFQVEYTGNNGGNEDVTTSVVTAFAPRVAGAAVLGTSFGKFLNGPMGDVLGARRTSIIYSLFMTMSLVMLACARTSETVVRACFLVEFTYSVLWPCCVITLATHYRGDSHGMYEGGVYITSLAARIGSLIGIPCCALLLRHFHWRFVALIGAWSSLVASSVSYLYVEDSPGKRNDPQNPIDESLLQKCYPDYIRRRKRPSFGVILRMAPSVIWMNVVPSVKHILSSGTFWCVSIAHTGASMVRTSERVLGTYLYETSNNSLSENRAAGLSVFLSVGTVAGLVVAGSIFASRQDRERKWMISRLYILTIVSCYVLAFLAIPSVRNFVKAPELVSTFQVIAIAFSGFGIAVQFYHIPSLVGATFGCDKGLFSSYTDGVAYGIASFVWRIVGDVVQHGSSDGGGWSYGWAAVALLLIPSAILMVEFMEHYFCRHRYGGTYETIIFA